MAHFAVTAVGADQPGIVSALAGALFELEMEGFEARAAQHELDHMEGLLILDPVDHAADLFPRRVYR